MGSNVVLVVFFVVGVTLVRASCQEAPGAPGSGNLYVIDNQNRLSTVDANTATMKNVSGVLSADVFAQQLSTIDSKNGIFYAVVLEDQKTPMQTALIGISTTTGSILSTTVIPFPSEAFVGVGQTCDFDGRTGEVLVSSQATAKGMHTILRVNPQTGQVKTVGQVEGMNLLGGCNGYDAKYNILWLEEVVNNTGTFFGVDATNGKVMHVVENTVYMSTMNFDPTTGLMWGIGLKAQSSTYVRTLVTLNSATATFNEVGVVEGYLIINGRIGAIDIHNRIYYAVMQENGDIQKTPNDLVGISMSTAAPVTHPHACGPEDVCFWSLEFQN